MIQKVHHNGFMFVFKLFKKKNIIPSNIVKPSYRVTYFFFIGFIDIFLVRDSEFIHPIRVFFLIEIKFLNGKFILLSFPL